jgi:hypothetical protein
VTDFSKPASALRNARTRSRSSFDTLAVDMLSREASPYDVAKMLGDTIDTVEKHYMPFVEIFYQFPRKPPIRAVAVPKRGESPRR